MEYPLREAIILAGGFGTRLRDLVSDLPKPMAPIGNRPFLEILFKALSQKKIKRLILSIGYMGEKIVEYFGKSYLDLEIIYEIEKEALGTGGAIKKALRHCQEDAIFVFNGDTYLDLEVDKVWEIWKKNQNSIIVGREVENCSRYGKLVISQAKVKKFIEKSSHKKGIINAGSYLLRKDSFSNFHFPKENFSLEKDFLAKKVETQDFDFFLTKGNFIDIGIPEDYQKAQTLSYLIN